MNSRPFHVLVGASLLLALAGCAGAEPVPAGSTAPARAPGSAPATLPEPIPTPWVGDAPGELSGEVATALLRVRDVAPIQFPANYVGIATGTQESKDMLVIYLAEPTADTKSALLEISGLPAETVKFEPA